MDISLVSIAFNGYGRFVPQFLAFAANMHPKPKEVVIVLGSGHRCDVELAKIIYPGVQIYEYKKKASFGKLRNIGISKTKSEWTWFVSIDDMPIKNAINTFKRVDKADYICAQWLTRGLGEKETLHISPLPQEQAQRLSAGQGMGFVIPHSPFKKWLWEKSPYKNSDFPNYDFYKNCIVNGAEFKQADKPTTVYLRRSNSHARTVLPRKVDIARKEKRKLIRVLNEIA